MVRRPRVLVLCGPSGSGKSSLLQILFKEYPDQFGFSVSHTSRGPRPGEIDGVHYHFTTLENMKLLKSKGEFLESAEFSNNHYGTSKTAVQEVISRGQVCVLDIDTAGVKQVKKSDLNAMYVFIKPPSMTELEERLRNRGTETEDSLQRRLSVARQEMEYGETPGNFDLVIVNDSLERTYAKLRDFILPELEKLQNGKIRDRSPHGRS